MVKDCTCCFFFSNLISIVFIGLTIKYSVIYDDSKDYNSNDCIITRVEYPTKLLTSLDNDQNKYNFARCSCGKRCLSDMGICNKIYIKNKNDNEILLKNKYLSLDGNCTFREKYCPDGEKIENRLYKIEENKLEMNKYINKTSIKCYNYKDEYFINNYNYLKETLICVFGLSLCVITTCIICCCFRRQTECIS